MSNPKIAIITGGTPNLAGPSGTLFLSLRSLSPLLYENSDKYFLTTSQISGQSFKALSSIGVTVEIFDASLNTNSSSYIRYFTEGILSKFEIFRLAQHYDKVVWLDSDQICTRELHGVISGLQHNFAITDGGDLSTGLDNFLKEPIDTLDYCDKNRIQLENPGLCGNFMVVNKRNCNDIYRQSIDLFMRFCHELYGGEQGIIFMIREKYFQNSLSLPNSLFSPHPDQWPLEDILSCDQDSKPYFIHAYSQPKFWNGLDYFLWNYFYQMWLGIGGERFILSKPKKFRSYIRQKIHKLIFSFGSHL